MKSAICVKAVWRIHVWKSVQEARSLWSMVVLLSIRRSVLAVENVKQSVHMMQSQKRNVHVQRRVVSLQLKQMNRDVQKST